MPKYDQLTHYITSSQPILSHSRPWHMDWRSNPFRVFTKRSGYASHVGGACRPVEVACKSCEGYMRGDPPSWWLSPITGLHPRPITPNWGGEETTNCILNIGRGGWENKVVCESTTQLGSMPSSFLHMLSTTSSMQFA